MMSHKNLYFKEAEIFKGGVIGKSSKTSSVI